jgi:hypothetical protein
MRSECEQWQADFNPEPESHLTDGVVDLVAARVVQILSLEPDLGPTRLGGQPVRGVNVRRPSHERVQGLELGAERRVCEGVDECLFQFVKAVDERFGSVLAAKLSETVCEGVKGRSSGANFRGGRLFGNF